MTKTMWTLGRRVRIRENGTLSDAVLALPSAAEAGARWLA